MIQKGLLVVFCLMLLIVALEDLRFRRISNVWNLIILACGLISILCQKLEKEATSLPYWLFRIVFRFMNDSGYHKLFNLPVKSHLIGLIIVSLPMLLISLVTKGGIGGGDIKFVAASGLFLGWELTLFGTLIGLVLNAIVAIILMLAHRLGRKDKIPLGPYLSIGFACMILL